MAQRWAAGESQNRGSIMDEDDLPPRREVRDDTSLGVTLGGVAGALVLIVLIFAVVAALIYGVKMWAS